MPRLTKNKTAGVPRCMIDERLDDFIKRMMAGTYGLSYGQLLTRAIDLYDPTAPDYEPQGKLVFIFATSLIDPEHSARLDAIVMADGRRKSTVIRNALARLMAVYEQPKKEVEIITIHEQESLPQTVINQLT